MFVRHHNNLAEQLKKLNPNWNGEIIFQETRKIVAAQIQIITYETWLPYVLGPIGMKMLQNYEGYNSAIDPTVSNEFATAAFRSKFFFFIFLF
jgi:hypothetical protein